MKVPREPIAISQVKDRLSEIFGDAKIAEAELSVLHPNYRHQWDAVFTAREYFFALEWRRSGSLGQVALAIRQLEMAKRCFPKKAIPLLATPYMGETARQRCERADISWLDLSGNARIIAPGIFYQNVGNPNRFRRAGRPASAFGPRGSRVTRRLLMEPDKVIKQRAIALRTGLDEGHTSRIIGKLIEDGLLEREENGISVIDPNVLLDAWREDYKFNRHDIFRGHIAARGGESLIHTIAENLSKIDEPYAATALPAAWLWTHHARFRLSTVYLSTLPSTALKKDLRFREESRGANTWLVVPNDEGIFDGSELVEGVRCVHPVQIYLDLKGHPERSTEAASELRRQFLLRDNDDS